MADDDSVDMAAQALDLAESWGTVDLDPSQIQELRRALETAWSRGRRVTPRISYSWGHREDEWWLVEYHDGEPHAAYHQLHGRIDATREMFGRWAPGAEGPCPDDHAMDASTPDGRRLAYLEIRHQDHRRAAARLAELGCRGGTVAATMVAAGEEIGRVVEAARCADLTIRDLTRRAVAAEDKLEQAERSAERTDRLSRRADSAESELVRVQEESESRFRDTERLQSRLHDAHLALDQVSTIALNAGSS